MNKSELSPIEASVKKELKSTFRDVDDLHLTVGVSGGIDSICLLHILHTLGIEMTVVHINYGTRGEASEQDANFVKNICRELNAERVIKKVDANKSEYSNFQAWARNIRYDIFRKTARASDSDAIAVAHNRNDQIETILQKILRGSGLAGWSAMEVWNGEIFRPLLNVKRKDITAFCKDQNIDYRLDRSNLTSNYARNFLRNEWLPSLNNHFPGWQQNILKVRKQAKVFQFSLEYILDDISHKDGLQRGPFLALPAALQKSLLLFFIKQNSVEHSVSRGALSQINELDALQTGKKIQLTDNLSLLRDRSRFCLVSEKEQKAKSQKLYYQKLQAGKTKFMDTVFRLDDYEEPNFEENLYLDAEKLKWPLEIRRWKEGDRIQPLGMKGRQTVADHLANRKISSAEKDKAAVIQSFEESIAAVIFPLPKKDGPPGTISEKYKCDESTVKTLIINRQTEDG